MSNKCNKRRMWRLSLFLAISTAFVLIGGSLAWFWQIEQEQHSRADAGNIIGAPSLSAANIDAIFARVGSPMLGTGKVVEQTSRQANIDDAFALAVWWVETNDGAAGVGRGDRNPGGVRSSAGYPVDGGNYTIYPSYAAAITDWFAILKSRYISRGLTSIYAISYPYVGTSGSGLWAGKVMTLVARYRGEGTPPTPTTAISPTPDATISPTSTSSSTQQRSGPFHPVRAADKASPAPSTHVTTPTHIAAPTPSAQLHSASAISTRTQSLLIALGLLTALLLALWSIKIRRSTADRVEQGRRSALPVPPLAMTGHRDPITPLPPLYINEFSPVLERYSPELAALVAGTSMEPSSVSNTFSSAIEVEQLPFPTTTSLPPWLSGNNTHAGKQGSDPLPVPFYGNIRSMKRSTDQLSVSGRVAGPLASMEAKSASAGDRDPNKDVINALSAWSGAPLPGHALASVGTYPAKKGGLLKRYADGTL